MLIPTADFVAVLGDLADYAWFLGFMSSFSPYSESRFEKVMLPHVRKIPKPVTGQPESEGL
jgi:hypothetical protein